MLPVAILAGGLATRLGSLTKDKPKSMVEVAGDPFIAHQLRLLRRQGIEDVVLCVGYLGDQIEAFVGDGGAFGLRVRYSYDGPTLLGTAGALKQALPLLGEAFFVLYGDSLLPCNFARVQQVFDASGLPALMTVFRNDGRWDASNVELASGRLLAYDKQRRTPAMQHIDYGLGILTSRVISELVIAYPCDLAVVYQQLLAQGRLAAHEVFERFYEVGSASGIAETSAFLREDQSHAVR